MQNRTVSCVWLPVVPVRRNEKHLPTSESSSTAESSTGKGFATLLRTKTENWLYQIKVDRKKQHAYVHSSSRLTEKGRQELHKNRATR